MDYYQLLGVDETADATRIKKAYKEKALQWHPDKNKNPIAKEMFQKINDAYSVLNDPIKRHQYDKRNMQSWAPSEQMSFEQADKMFQDIMGNFAQPFNQPGFMAFGPMLNPFSMFQNMTNATASNSFTQKIETVTVNGKTTTRKTTIKKIGDKEDKQSEIIFHDGNNQRIILNTPIPPTVIPQRLTIQSPDLGYATKQYKLSH